MKTRTLGKPGLEVSALGFGCMGMTWAHGASGDRNTLIRLLRDAIVLGITFFDTAEVHGPRTDEALVGEALAPLRDWVVIAAKFGFEPDADGVQRPAGLNSRPGHIKAVADASLKRLRTDHIDLFYGHRVDPGVPIEDVAGAVADLVKAGKVMHFGLSEAGVETIRRAHAVHPVTTLQMEYSLWSREPGEKILPVLEELGIGLVARSPQGRGFLTGRFGAEATLGEGGLRKSHPRSQARALPQDIGLAQALTDIAEPMNITPGQLALAWLLHRKPWIVPIPGTRNPERLIEIIEAPEVTLDAADLAQIDKALAAHAVEGLRHGERALAGVSL